MLNALLGMTLGLCPLPQGLPNAPVVINEIQYDEFSVSPDLREFVELYNRSAVPMDISGWTVTNKDGPNAAVVYTVPANTILLPGGFWVMGSTLVPGVHQVLSLAPARTELLWNENAAITLRDTGSLIMDTVFQEANKGIFDATLKEAEGLWGNFQSTTGMDSSWSRIRDGHDTNDNGRDFRTVPWTPGASNSLASLLPYFSLFDQNNVNDTPPEFGGSFKLARVVDPAVATIYNPNAIPPSPQGGKALLMWDDVGGGNSNMLLSDTQRDWLFEAYVYFDSLSEVAGEYETWSVGFGSTCSLFNTPDPSRTLFATASANGNTGVCWTFQNTSTGSVLYLVDHNNGGADHVVLGQIPLTHNVNDGWQRLRLEVHGDRVEGWFGGTLGRGDGQRIAGTLAASVPNGFYVGYRELIFNNLTCRPFTCDVLSIGNPRSAVAEIGTAVPTTRGLPALDTLGFPTLGWQGFGLKSTGLVPNGTTAFVLGATLLATPIDLRLLGGQTGSMVYQSLDLVLTAPSNPQGEATLTLSIPPVSALSGASLFAQNLDPDLALLIPLPLGNSKTLKLTLGD